MSSANILVHRFPSMAEEAIMSEKGLESIEMLDPITRQHVERAAAALEDEFAGIFGPETIARYIAESTDLLGGAKHQRLRAGPGAPLRPGAAEGAGAGRRHAR